MITTVLRRQHVYTLGCVCVCKDSTCFVWVDWCVNDSLWMKYPMTCNRATYNKQYLCVYLSSILCLLMASSYAQRMETNSKLSGHKNTHVYDFNSHMSLNERLSWCSGMRNIFCMVSIFSLRGSPMWKFFIRWAKAMYSSSSATLRPEKTSKVRGHKRMGPVCVQIVMENWTKNEEWLRLKN